MRQTFGGDTKVGDYFSIDGKMFQIKEEDSCEGCWFNKPKRLEPCRRMSCYPAIRQDHKTVVFIRKKHLDCMN